MSKKIFFLVPYPLKESPSQRFRFEQYFDILRENGWQIDIQSFLNSQNWHIFFKSGNGLNKGIALLGGFIKRVEALFRSPSFDFVFIHREAAPLGPPLFEWVLAKVLRKRIIYDFDDAIWLTDKVREPSFAKLLKWRGKVGSICRWSYQVSCGNQYLADYASCHNNKVMVNPTTIDTSGLHNPDRYPKRSEAKRVVIGWTGSHSTLKYLEVLTPVLQKLEVAFPFIQTLVIADRRPELDLKRLIFLPWKEDTEILDLMNIDIGIMPLPNDNWTKGKCGFKALQYMALKKPVVAAEVGVNPEIITHGVNGFLCTSEEEWETALTSLIQDEVLRTGMGVEGRKTVLSRYSVSSNTGRFLSLFE